MTQRSGAAWCACANSVNLLTPKWRQNEHCYHGRVLHQALINYAQLRVLGDSAIWVTPQLATCQTGMGQGKGVLVSFLDFLFFRERGWARWGGGIGVCVCGGGGLRGGGGFLSDCQISRPSGGEHVWLFPVPFFKLGFVTLRAACTVFMDGGLTLLNSEAPCLTNLWCLRFKIARVYCRLSACRAFNSSNRVRK